MARIRSIKPEYWADQELTLLPRDVRLLYIALWNFADEQGRMQGDPRLIKSWCFPLDDDVTATVINKWLDALIDVGKVKRYVVAGAQYLYLYNLFEHQRLDPRLESRLPPPPDLPAETQKTLINTDQKMLINVPNADSHQPERALAGSRWQVAGSKEQVAGMFDAFWSAYPRKIAKGAARKAWTKSATMSDPAIIIEAANRYAADKTRDPKFTAYPATWLNQERWNDEESSKVVNDPHYWRRKPEE